MKHMKKLLALVIAAALMLPLGPYTAAADSNANANIIYQTTSSENITSGVTHQTITRFTDNGWVNINVLKVDLSNQYIKLDTMSSSSSIKSLSTVQSMAQSNGAVAAINGGFFNWLGDANSGYPDGPIVQSGKILSASNEYNRYSDTMATFAVNNLNQILFNYWKTDITLIAPNGQSTVVNQYNKCSSLNYTDFTILDRKWGAYTMGADATMPDVVEMIVSGGKVAEIRQGQPATIIPENGYVVITRQAGAQFLTQNFKVGDPVVFNISTNPDWNSIKMAVSGSAILVKDGQIPSKYSLDIAGRQPRTAVGSSKDGKQLILVTVDGRQNSSIGMTQPELSQLMLDLGAYNAMNLDGGGSSTMVERTPGTSTLSVVNSPSDGSPRGVATAVGIISIAPPSALAGLIIDTDDTNVFVNTSRKFTVRGYDRYLNPVNIDQSTVKWSVSGIKGGFSGSSLTPAAVGSGKVKATIGNISATLDIDSLSSPVQLILDNSSLKLGVGDTQAFTVKGKNKNGYYAGIYPSDVNWAVKGNAGKISQGTFTATAPGTGYIDASVGNVHAYCSLSVATDTSVLKDDFEALNGTFLSYPATVSGNYEISSEQKHSGNSSGKLTYDFTNLEGTRAAYMVLGNNGLILDPNTAKLGIWVYNTHPNSNWLRAEIYDANGRQHLVDFTRVMDWTGWKYVEASLDSINSPAKLTRIYLAQPWPVSDSGFIYLDDLSVTTSTYPVVDPASVPKDTVPVDDANKSTIYKKTSDSFRFSVFGQSRDPMNDYENTVLSGLADRINKYLDAAAIVGGNQHAFTQQVKTPLASTYTGYKSFDIQSSRFLQLDMSKQGLRSTDPVQWHWFLQQLDSAKGDNVFIFLENTPASFSDSLEAKLFQDTLTAFKQKTGKNVFVFYNGDSNTSYMERGVKYISTTGLNSADPLVPGSPPLQFLVVTVKGSSVIYEFKPV